MLNIAIIGNGCNTKKYGSFIDSFDEVVRINGGAMERAISENSEYVGTKTTLAVFNNWNFKTDIPTHPDVLEAHKYAIENNIPIAYSRKNIIIRKGNELKNGIPIEYLDKVPKQTIFGITKDLYDYIEQLYDYKHPTSGLKILFYFLKQGYRDIALFNFGFTGVHFFDKKWHDVMTDKRFEAHYHNGKIERDIIEDLQRKVLVKIYE
ncbi:MAG TPA: hypothetical protein GXZ87_07700 [Bacteroidales bacterium]|nr:hypothetical protein [Bacteroidales bacterium]